MPKEYALLKDKPQELDVCPRCKHGMDYFLRGQVQSCWRKFFGMKYCAVICWRCKNIVGHEKP